MKLTAQEWQLLRLPLIVLGLVLICAGLLGWFAYQQNLAAETALRAQERQLNQAHQRYQSSGQEKDIIVQYLPAYQRLIAEGFIGEERRIEWVDYLRTVHQQNKLFGISYSIGAQENYKPIFELNPGVLSLHRSVMKLELAMLHEGDLLLLLDKLKAQKLRPSLFASVR